MAFFKLRKGGESAPATARQPESIEAMRKRARHRLIGAGVLVLIGVIGFPLVFDTQPRPIAVDIPIEIPDRNKVKPLPVPAPAATTPVSASAPAAATSVALAKAESPPEPKPAASASAPAQTQPPPKQEFRPEAVAQPKPEAKPDAKPADARAPEKKPAEAKPAEVKAASAQATPKPADDGARALALLEGKAPSAASQPAAEGRFIVQVGAFADATKARETRLKVEKAGMKTYTHVAETKEGKLIRVRVGPFPTKAEAESAAQKIKALDLKAAVLSL